jgi:hypothetical protein
MKLEIAAFKLIEIALIGVMSLCGVIAFISAHLFTLESYVPLIIWGALFSFGVLLIVLASRGLGMFTWLVILLSLPSILSFDSLDLPKMLQLFELDQVFKTNLGFFEILALVIIIITGYVLLNFILTLNKSRTWLVKRGANSADADRVFSKSYLGLILLAGMAVIMSTLIVVLTKFIELYSTPVLKTDAPSILMVGIICIVLIVIYLYWLAASRKQSP